MRAGEGQSTCCYLPGPLGGSAVCKVSLAGCVCVLYVCAVCLMVGGRNVVRQIYNSHEYNSSITDEVGVSNTHTSCF